MKRLNNKGMTITELIVSFAIVGVAIVYFYQTVKTVSDLYYTSTKETQEFVDRTYIEKLISVEFDEYVESMKAQTIIRNEITSDLNTFCNKIDDCTGVTIAGQVNNIKGSTEAWFRITINGSYKILKYKPKFN